jgi:hypothetical protein
MSRTAWAATILGVFAGLAALLMVVWRPVWPPGKDETNR